MITTKQKVIGHIKKKCLDRYHKGRCMKLLLYTCLIALTLLRASFAGTIDQNISDNKYVEYGKKHECVVPISGYFGDNKQPYNASAVIIKPRIVLTAAHVVQKAKDCFITLDKEKINVLLAVILEEYKEDNIGPYDLAICYLEKEANISFYPELYGTDDEVNKVCSLAGCGITGKYSTGMSHYDGKKRAGSNKIDGITNGMLVCSVNKPPKTSLEFLICSGDSGGGLFIDQKLAGIHSCIMTSDGKLNADFNDESLHTRISIHKDWIENIVAKLETLDKEEKLDKK